MTDEIIGRARLTTIHTAFDAPMRNLPQVTRTLSALDDLWAVAYETAVVQRSLESGRMSYSGERPDEYWRGPHGPRSERSQWTVPRPDSVKIQLASPLVVELAGTLSWPIMMATTAGTLRYLIKNADAVGSFLPRLFESWYSTWTDAYEARERWRNRRGQPLTDHLDQLTNSGQEAGAILAEAQPREPKVTGPGAEWSPTWEGEQQR